MKYLGKLVAFDTLDGKYPGLQEVIIIKESENRLYGLDTKGGYEFSYIKNIDLVGEKPHKIISVSNLEDEYLNRFIKEIESFIEEPKIGKRHWVDSVYNAALTNLRYLKEATSTSIWKNIREYSELSYIEHAGLNLIVDEYLKAVKKFGKFNSAHEGFAVLKEEVDELWDEVKKNQDNRSLQNLEKEAIQVAAMGFRFLTDVVYNCPRKKA